MIRAPAKLLAFCCWALSALPGAAHSADATAGRRAFQQQCLLCHSAETGDRGGAQGPSLAGVYGRTSAALPNFGYSAALRAAHLHWDEATLQRFLADPAAMVPGTLMAAAVAEPRTRSDLIAYLQSLANTPPTAAASATAPMQAGSDSAAGNWDQDAPGRVHRISAAALPPPYATPSAGNGPSASSRPSTALLALPPRFHAEVYTRKLSHPRKLLVAPNGDVFVSETAAGRISVLHPNADGTGVARIDRYLEGLKQPFGLAFYPSAQNPQWLYVAETMRVTRWAYQVGDSRPRGSGEVVAPDIPQGGSHFTRDVAFSADGASMYVSVGSASNIADDMPKKSAEEIQLWRSTQAPGAAWGPETHRAAVLVYEVGKTAAPRVLATGLRNCVSLTVQPASGALWCTTNERDGLGDDLVPDYSTRIRAGGFYGWPWYYLGGNPDPRRQGERPDLAGQALMPEVLYQAHSAALSMTFYTASGGGAAFPDDYVGDAFVAFHGSWNRRIRTGYKLVRVRMNKDSPSGEYQDFLTGFVIDNARVWGRPVATAELADGSLLMSEDANDVIFRISYQR